MIMSLSFKAKEKELWEHVQSQFDAAYYIKMLIFNDFNSLNKVSVEKEIPKIEKVQNTGYADIDI